MTLEKAIQRVLRVKLAEAEMTMAEWGRRHGQGHKTAAYKFQKGFSNLRTLIELAESFGVTASSILCEAEKLVADGSASV